MELDSCMRDSFRCDIFHLHCTLSSAIAAITIIILSSLSTSLLLPLVSFILLQTQIFYHPTHIHTHTESPTPMKCLVPGNLISVYPTKWVRPHKERKLSKGRRKGRREQTNFTSAMWLAQSKPVRSILMSRSHLHPHLRPQVPLSLSLLPQLRWSILLWEKSS